MEIYRKLCKVSEIMHPLVECSKRLGEREEGGGMNIWIRSPFELERPNPEIQRTQFLALYALFVIFCFSVKYGRVRGGSLKQNLKEGRDT